MDASTAIVIGAVVVAVALSAAAFLTGRGRIGALTAAADASTPWAGLSEQARQFRVFGWILVGFLYLAAVFCLLQGFNTLIVQHHWTQWQAAFGDALSAQSEIALYARFWLAIAAAFVVIAFWAQRRLRRRAA
jgi:hypothetical protein